MNTTDRIPEEEEEEEEERVVWLPSTGRSVGRSVERRAALDFTERSTTRCVTVVGVVVVVVVVVVAAAVAVYVFLCGLTIEGAEFWSVS
ncbi:hypothetical protein F2P81_004270 [Scophthalmus maximus]|uniref:Uncharacterized protein n=1 Tax=Scophthalmus maximus TaxID=52904 RepID=A0A6A4TAA2_SCOMX|nr:hypothetical protein F2P81_004270 [Scophthalmus maximus]